MRCISPLKASQRPDGTICYNYTESSAGLLPIQFECRKCLPCRLNIAREKAIRSIHEAQMHEDNIFLTLTYDEDHLISDRLIYKDFQNFMKSLREKRSREAILPEDKDRLYIPYMVTGEYGEINKRPHWHAILFNYRPHDSKYKYTTDLGENTFTSEFLSKLWKKGNLEYGSVTMESAGYVARYAAKKLVHGKDQDHDYHPIHKLSSRRAIGRSWIEKHYQHTFNNGYVYLPNGSKTKIPRYYSDWCKKYHPKLYRHYVTNVRSKIIEKAEQNARKEELDFFTQVFNRGVAHPMKTRANVKLTIMNSKFKNLQENLKL